jgi:hypothetical protein
MAGPLAGAEGITYRMAGGKGMFILQVANITADTRVCKGVCHESREASDQLGEALLAQRSSDMRLRED